MKSIANQHVDNRLAFAQKLCFAIGAIGGAIVALGLVFVWSTGWGVNLFAPGAALLTVSLTAYVAAGGVISWREQRQRDRESAEYRHREEVYEEMADYIVKSFIGEGRDLKLDVKLRVSAALWGSADTVVALKNWQETIHRILANHGIYGGGSVTMTDEESVEVRSSVAKVLVAMRNDLASTTGQAQVDEATLLGSIFNG